MPDPISGGAGGTPQPVDPPPPQERQIAPQRDADAEQRAEGGGAGATVAGGVRLAVTTLTVLPVRPGRVDRQTAAVAMAVAPVVGAGLGVLLSAVLVALTAAGAPSLVAAAVTVAAGALLTRGLHLDGLADTVDALGSYRSGQAALEIMKKPDIGPFGVAAIGLVLLIQAAALAGLAGRGWTTLVTVVLAYAAGRLGVILVCRRGVPAARPDGLGALVAGTVPRPVAVAVLGAVTLAAVGAVPGRPWQGPVGVVVTLAAVALLVRHAVRRFGGITGDVIGAAVEVATTLALLALVLGTD